VLQVGSRDIADEIDLDERVVDQQPGGSDGRPWRRDLEVLLPDLVEAGEIVRSVRNTCALMT